MRPIALLSLLVLGACHAANSQGEAVRQAYDNRADRIENAADAQPSATAKDIYHARADALREEGKDRQKGLEGGEPSSGEGGRGRGGDAGSRQGG